MSSWWKTFVLSLLFLVIGHPALALNEAHYRQFASQALQEQSIWRDSPLFSVLEEELFSNFEFRKMLDRGDDEAARRFSKTLLRSEVHLALKNTNYPAEKFFSLYPFIVQETKAEPGNKALQNYAKESLRRYRSMIDQDLILAANVYEHGGRPFTDQKKLLASVKKLSFENQIRVFNQALQKNGTQPFLREIFTLWAKDFSRQPARNPSAFLKFYRSFHESSPAAAHGEQILGEGIVRLYARRDQIARRTIPFSLDKKKVDSLIAQLELFIDHLPPRERVLMHLMKDPKKSRFGSAIYGYLYSTEKIGHLEIDAVPFFLKNDEYSLNPRAKDGLSKALRDWFESDDFIQDADLRKRDDLKIGPTMFAKMAEENPVLAEKHLKRFVDKELYPHFFGKIRFGSERIYDLNAAPNRSIGKAMDRALEFIRNSKEYELKKDIHRFLTEASPNTRNLFKYHQEARLLIDMVDLDSPEGLEFAFNVIPDQDKTADPHFRQIVKKYLSHLSEHPEKLVRNLKYQNAFFRYFVTAQAKPSAIFGDDLSGLKKFTKAYFSTYSDILLANEPAIHSKLSSYLNVFKDYVETGHLDRHELLAMMQEYTQMVNSFNGKTYPTSFDQELRDGITEMRSFLQNYDHQKAVKTVRKSNCTQDLLKTFIGSTSPLN